MAGIYLPHADNDPLGSGERAFAQLPQVLAIKSRLTPVNRDGDLHGMPQNLIDMRRWSAQALALDWTSASERMVLDAFAHDGNLTVQDDDFGADFDRHAALHNAPP